MGCGASSGKAVAELRINPSAQLNVVSDRQTDRHRHQPGVLYIKGTGRVSFDEGGISSEDLFHYMADIIDKHNITRVVWDGDQPGYSSLWDRLPSLLLRLASRRGKQLQIKAYRLKGTTNDLQVALEKQLTKDFAGRITFRAGENNVNIVLDKQAFCIQIIESDIKKEDESPYEKLGWYSLLEHDITGTDSACGSSSQPQHRVHAHPSTRFVLCVGGGQVTVREYERAREERIASTWYCINVSGDENDQQVNKGYAKTEAVEDISVGAWSLGGHTYHIWPRTIAFVAAQEQKALVDQMRDSLLAQLGTEWSVLTSEARTAASWHLRLQTAEFVFVLLSEEFVLNAECETDLTFAYDNSRQLVPILVHFDSFSAVMKNPPNFESRIRVPKLNSMLNRCNRLPPTGNFKDRYNQNIAKLVKRIQATVSKAEDYVDPNAVVLSYQSTQEKVLVAARKAFRSQKVATVDGTEVRVGEDWRQFYFTRLASAKLFFAIITPQYLASRACEDEITYAYDQGKKLFCMVREGSEEDQLFRKLLECPVPKTWDRINYAQIQRFRALCKRVEWILVPELPTSEKVCATSLLTVVNVALHSPRAQRDSNQLYQVGSVFAKYPGFETSKRQKRQLQFLVNVIHSWEFASASAAALDFAFLCRDEAVCKVASDEILVHDDLEDDDHEDLEEQPETKAPGESMRTVLAPQTLTRVLIDLLKDKEDRPVDGVCLGLSNLVGRPDNMDLGRFCGDEELVKLFERNLKMVKEVDGGGELPAMLLERVDPAKDIEANNILVCLNNLIGDLELRKRLVEADWVPRIVACLKSEHKLVRLKASSLLQKTIYTFQHKSEFALNIYAKSKFCNEEQNVKLVTDVLSKEFESPFPDIMLMENLAWAIQNICFLGTPQENKFRNLVCEAGTIRALVHLLKEYNSERAAGALGPMGFQNKEMHPLAEELGVVVELTQLLKKDIVRPHWDSPVEGWHKTAAALQSFVVEPKFAKQAVDLGALPTLVALRHEALSANLKEGRRVAAEVLNIIEKATESSDQVKAAESAWLQKTFDAAFSELGTQQLLIEELVLPHVRANYFKPGDKIEYGIIGSTGRGTDMRLSLKAAESDIDVAFCGVPVLSQDSDWTNRPRNPTDGRALEDWASVQKEGDQVLIKTISAVMEGVRKHLGREVKFKYVRAWSDFKGCVFSFHIEAGDDVTYKGIKLPASQDVDFDIILGHDQYSFGVQHTTQFVESLQRVSADHGKAVAGEALCNIRSLKGMCKMLAHDPITGKQDRKRKVPGLVVELCFINGRDKPPTMQKLAASVEAFTPPESVSQRETVVAQDITVIDKQWNVEQLLSQCPSVTAGGLATLKKAVAEMVRIDPTAARY